MTAAGCRLACELYESGISARKIAARLGSSETTVINALKRAGVQRRKVGRTARHIVPLEEMGTVSDQELAERYDCTPSWVQEQRARAGIRAFDPRKPTGHDY